MHIFDEDRHAAFAKFKPDFIISLLWPQLEYFKVFYEEDPFGLSMFGIKQIAHLSPPIGVVELDHILYYKQTEPRDVFAFITAFDKYIWSCIFVAALAVSILSCDFTKGIRDFMKQYFLAITSIVNMASSYRHLKYRFETSKYLLALWLALTMIIQQYFGGDLLATLAMEPKPILIDSFNDLRNKSIGIAALDVDMIDGDDGSVESYFNPDSEYSRDLTSRLSLFGLNEVADTKKLAKNLLGNGLEDISTAKAILGPKTYVEYAKNFFEDGKYRDVTHVSSEGADAQFHVFGRLLTADSKEGHAMDYM